MADLTVSETLNRQQHRVSCAQQPRTISGIVFMPRDGYPLTSQMGEHFFSALEARSRAGKPLSGPGVQLATGEAPARADDAAAEHAEAGTGENGSAAADHDGAALSRAEFEALVGQELRTFAYNRPHHALDFRIACSCVAALPSPHTSAKVACRSVGSPSGVVSGL